MKEQQKCQTLKDNGKPPTTGATDCRTADLKGKIAKVESKVLGAIINVCIETRRSRTAHELRRRGQRPRATV
jgi:hypothetical protein